MALRVVVAYDIANDANRARVAAMLATHGIRIQRSVFVCLMGTEALQEFVDRVRTIINLSEDVLHVIPTCAQCQEGQISLGKAVKEGDTPFWIAF